MVNVSPWLDRLVLFVLVAFGVVGIIGALLSGYFETAVLGALWIAACVIVKVR